MHETRSWALTIEVLILADRLRKDIDISATGMIVER